MAVKTAFPDNELIEVFGAREHNLRDIDVSFPRNKLVVITGLSGSGKSSLAFDTIYAEGQRRYMESFSAYARQFLGTLERPDVDKITGLSPVVAIEQKSTNQNPRSTVGTITEIYDFLRLLFARAGTAFSYETGKPMVRLNESQITSLIGKDFSGRKIMLYAPLIKGRKGHYRELFEQYLQLGFLKMRINGDVTELTRGMQLERYKTHDIELFVDSMTVNSDNMQRLSESLALAMKYGKGTVMVTEGAKQAVKHYSLHLMCEDTGISYDEPAPNSFSFNSPYGWCKKCNGLGTIPEIDSETIMPDLKKTIRQGGIVPLGQQWDSWTFRQVEAIGQLYDFDMDTPVGELSEEAVSALMYGTEEMLNIPGNTGDNKKEYQLQWNGIVNIIINQLGDKTSESLKKWARRFMHPVTCTRCEGARLRKEALYFKVDGQNIAQLAAMDLSALGEWFESLENRLKGKEKKVATEVAKEIRKRIKFLINVGLEYLSLDRSSKTLSGGEAQRIRLASQIGSQLVGVLYILDEPSIGLHQRDNMKLIHSLKELRDLGNSVIVVEHDKETIINADYILDVGPGAGLHGGKIVGQGTIETIKNCDTITAKYLTGEMAIEMRNEPRPGSGQSIQLKGAKGNNLKNINVDFPLGKLIVVTGVSGSGKSTLIYDTLFPAMHNHFFKTNAKPLEHKGIEGLKHIDKVIEVDQSPIGRTPRSNPATYTGVFTDIRNLYVALPESKIRGYSPGRFSFNVKGGRCETCKGGGMKLIEMNFLPDVLVECETCNGRRYNRETLEVRYKGKSISDVLNMSIEDAVLFFENIPSITSKIQTLKDVGLGYITLGQQSTTLSGGEAQRVKLASELTKRDTGNTFYILDEPTTGLHFEDVRILLEVLDKLVDKGNTVLIIEHNMDVIKMADYIIDLGPEGGSRGGQVLFEGSPGELLEFEQSHTAEFLRHELEFNH